MLCLVLDQMLPSFLFFPLTSPSFLPSSSMAGVLNLVSANSAKESTVIQKERSSGPQTTVVEAEKQPVLASSLQKEGSSSFAKGVDASLGIISSPREITGLSLTPFNKKSLVSTNVIKDKTFVQPLDRVLNVSQPLVSLVKEGGNESGSPAQNSQTSENILRLIDNDVQTLDRVKPSASTQHFSAVSCTREKGVCNDKIQLLDPCLIEIHPLFDRREIVSKPSFLTISKASGPQASICVEENFQQPVSISEDSGVKILIDGGSSKATVGPTEGNLIGSDSLVNLELPSQCNSGQNFIIDFGAYDLEIGNRLPLVLFSRINKSAISRDETSDNENWEFDGIFGLFLFSKVGLFTNEIPDSFERIYHQFRMKHVPVKEYGSLGEDKSPLIEVYADESVDTNFIKSCLHQAILVVHDPIIEEFVLDSAEGSGCVDSSGGHDVDFLLRRIRQEDHVFDGEDDWIEGSGCSTIFGGSDTKFFLKK